MGGPVSHFGTLWTHFASLLMSVTAPSQVDIKKSMIIALKGSERGNLLPHLGSLLTYVTAPSHKDIEKDCNTRPNPIQNVSNDRQRRLPLLENTPQGHFIEALGRQRLEAFAALLFIVSPWIPCVSLWT